MSFLLVSLICAWSTREQDGVSVSEGYVKAISGLLNLSEREAPHFHNHHLSSPDPPHCSAAEPSVRDGETSVQDPVRPHPPTALVVLYWSVSWFHPPAHCLATLDCGGKRACCQSDEEDVLISDRNPWEALMVFGCSLAEVVVQKGRKKWSWRWNCNPNRCLSPANHYEKWSWLSDQSQFQEVKEIATCKMFTCVSTAIEHSDWFLFMIGFYLKWGKLWAVFRFWSCSFCCSFFPLKN